MQIHPSKKRRQLPVLQICLLKHENRALKQSLVFITFNINSRTGFIIIPRFYFNYNSIPLNLHLKQFAERGFLFQGYFHLPREILFTERK